MVRMHALRKYFPLIIGAIILLVIGLISPWSEINQLLRKIDPNALYLLFALSITYYLAKAFRFWCIIRLLGVKLPLGKVILVYMAAQPVSILPAGELYRSILVERYLGAKVRKTAPAITLQGLVEAIVLLSFSLVGAFLLGHHRVVVLSIAILFIILILALQRGWLLGRVKWLNKVPFISVSQHKYEAFIKGHQELLKPAALSLLVSLSLIPVLCGIFILYIAARSINADISFIEAAISFTLPVIVSGLSLLPGGVGVGEGGTIGLLYIFGFSTAAAITTTLLMRVFTLISGITYGFIAQIIVHFTMDKR